MLFRPRCRRLLGVRVSHFVNLFRTTPHHVLGTLEGMCVFGSGGLHVLHDRFSDWGSITWPYIVVLGVHLLLFSCTLLFLLFLYERQIVEVRENHLYTQE